MYPVSLTIREDQNQLELAALPDRLLLAWDATLPILQIEQALRVACGLRIEPKGMVLSPELSVTLSAAWITPVAEVV